MEQTAIRMGVKSSIEHSVDSNKRQNAKWVAGRRTRFLIGNILASPLMPRHQHQHDNRDSNKNCAGRLELTFIYFFPLRGRRNWKPEQNALHSLYFFTF